MTRRWRRWLRRELRGLAYAILRRTGVAQDPEFVLVMTRRAEIERAGESVLCLESSQPGVNVVGAALDMGPPPTLVGGWIFRVRDMRPGTGWDPVCREQRVMGYTLAQLDEIAARREEFCAIHE